MYNSLKHVKKLEEAGISREQAEAHVQIMTEVMETNLATKEDLKDLATLVQHEIAVVRQEMKELSLSMTIKLGTIVSLSIGVAVALAKIIHV